MTTKRPPRNPSVLLRAIRTTFPELTWNSYRYINHGWDHEVIILDDAMVFRFPNDDDYAKLLPVEVAVLRHVRQAVTASVPDYRWVAPDASFAGYPIIPGTILDPKVFGALPATTRDAIAVQLAAALSALHSLKLPASLCCQVPDFYLATEQAEVKRDVKRHLTSLLSKPDFQLVQTILTEVDTLLDRPLPRVFVHGDMYSQHLLWNAKADRLGIIDFSDMVYGDPAIDFAELYEYGADFVGAVYRHYAGPKDDGFLDRSWIYQRWTAVYMMTDHFAFHKTSFAKARTTFNRIKRGRR